MHILRILFGIFFMSVGLFFILLYTNLFSIGYSFTLFVHFISRRIECLLFLIGVILLVSGIGGNCKNVLRLRRSFKLWK